MSFDPMGYLFKYPFVVTEEIFSILPDGIILMTGLFAFLTLSIPFGMLFLSLLESLLIHRGLSAVLRFITISTETEADLKERDAKCVSGFRGTTLEKLSMFSGDTSVTFPSPSIYIISVLSAYIYNSLNAVIPELEELGPQYLSRFYLSVIFLCLFLFVFCAFRLFAGCESMSNLIISLFSGITVGSILIMQNMSLFGKNTVNLLGIPLLGSTTADGSSMNICIQSQA
jgi:hypothetical protein